MTKECTACQKVLPLDDFYVRKDTGRQTGECKLCRRERSSQHYQENRERHAEVVKRRYETFGRFKRYGLTPEGYAETLQQQGHACALCHSPEPGGKGEWHIDHEHPTGQSYHGFKASDGRVRGILCHRCNGALGHYENLLHRVGLDALNAYLRGPVNDPGSTHAQGVEEPHANPALPRRGGDEGRA